MMGFQPPIDRATIDKYTEDIAVSGEKIRTLLGFSPEYDLALGWHETVQEMRAAKNPNGLKKGFEL
jgi:hypothetical protein